MTPEQKMERLMSPAEAAGLLRSLAEKLEAGNLEFGHVSVELNDFFSVKQTVKTKSDRLCFKLKLKYEKSLHQIGALTPAPTHPLLEKDLDEDEEEKPSGRPSGYKQLKKTMGRGFKQIGETLKLGNLPDPILVHSFHEQCQAMTTFPGKGEEHYQAFLEQAGLLLASVRQRDLTQAAAAYAALGAMKKACHAQYK